MVFLGFGLNRDPRVVPSPFIDKPAPEFAASTLFNAERIITPEHMLGTVWALNVWASWCAACRDEHPLLNQLHQTQTVTLVGLNYKDAKQDAIKWLDHFENPYEVVVFDRSGDIGIDYGVYGVPETFVIDKRGIIRHKHIGPLTQSDIEQTLKPLIAKLKQEKS